VPLIFAGAGVTKGTHTDRVTVNDLAPTLGAVAGVHMPGVPGHILESALVAAASR
jgi:hypothetical protein